MAIPATPTNYFVQTGNGQVFLSWNLSAGATSYDVQRSTDNITFSSIATPSINKYLDTTVVMGTAYYYKVAAVNVDGTSIYTAVQAVCPSPTGELCLGELRVRAQQRADKLNSQFVTLSEWNYFINNAMFELYDLLVTAYEDYYITTPAAFTTNGSTYLYPLPDGVTSFINGVSNASGYIAPPFYKLRGVDLSINNAQNAWVTLNKFMFNDRNRYLYPNSSSTIYGVFNMQYRLVGNNIELIPTPTGNQQIRLWYIPRLSQLLQDTDLTTTGISGWLQYVIVRAAKYALDKEESDTSKLDSELTFLKARIEESAVNRDEGQPDRIQDVRQGGYGNNGGFGGGWNGPQGGW